MRRDSINPPNGHSPPNGQCVAGQIKEDDEDNIEETQQQQPALPPYYRRSSIGQNIGGGNYPSPLSHLERLSEEREDSSSQVIEREMRNFLFLSVAAPDLRKDRIS